MANGSELVPELNPALPSGTNPLEGLREIAARPQFTPEETAEYERPDLITGGLRAGLYSTVGAGAEAVGLPGVSDFLSRRAAANAPKLNDYRDIHSAEDLIRYGLGTGATAIGSTLPTLIPGLGLGGLAGRAALSLRAAAPAVRAARTVGSAAGAYGAALPMEMGEVLLEAKAKGMDTNDATIRQVAWDKALINAALEAALPAMLGGKLLKGVRPSIRRTALGSAGVEGTTEGAQEISGIFADSRITGQPVDLSNPDTRARIINSIIGGALGGGGIGTVVGGLEKLGSAQLPSLPSREAQPESTGDVYRDAEGNEERSTTNLYRDADEEVERMFDTSVPPSGPPPGGAGAAVFKEEAPAQVDAGAYIADVMRRAGDFRNPEHRATFLSSAAAKLASMSDSVKGWAKGVAQIITDRSNMVQQPRQQLDLFADQPDAVAAFISGAAWAPRSITDLPGTLQFMANPNNRAQATRYIYEGLPAEDRAQITNPDFNDIATQATVGRMYAGRIAKERVQRVNGIIGRVRAAMPDTRQGRLFSEELNQEDLNLSATIADKMRSIMSANMMTAMATKGPAGQRAERVVEGMRERTAKAAAINPTSESTTNDVARSYALGLREIFKSDAPIATQAAISMYEELADVLDSHEEALAVLESARALYGSNMDLDTLATIRQSDHELVKRFAATNLDDRQASKVLQGLQAILIGEPIRNREQLRLLNIAFGGNEARMEALLTRIKANHQPLGRTAEAFEAPIGPIQEEEVTTEEAERAAGLRPEGETEGFQEEAPAARFELGLSKAFVPASDKALVASTVKRLREQYPDIGIEVRPLSVLSEEEAGKDPTEFLIDFLERSTDKRATQQLAELSEVLDDPTGVDEVLGKYVYFRYGEGTRGEELSAQDYAAIKSAANTKGSAEQGTLTLLDAEGKQQIFSAVEMVKRFMRMSGVRSADALPVNIQRALAAGIGAIAERSDAKSFFAQPGKKIEIKAGIVPSPFRAERPELLLSNLKIGESDPMVERILTWAKKQVTPRLTEFDTKRGTSLPDASIAFGMGDRNFTLDVSSSAMQIREGDKVVAGPVLRPDLLVHRTADKKDMLWRDVQVKPEPASIAEYMSPSARAKAETRLNRAITSQLATAQKSGNKQLEATMRDLAGRANKFAIIDEISEMDFDAAQEHPLFQAYEAVLEDAGPSIANAASREQERTDAPKRTSPETQIIEEIIEEPGQRARRVERAVPIETRERVVRRAGATKAEELLGGTQIAIPGPTRQQPEFEAEEMNRATAAKREAQPRIFDEFETLVGTPLRGSKAPAGPAEFGATQVPEGVRGTREPTTLARAVMRARRLVESTPENKAILNRAERAGGHPELTGAMRQELIQAVNRHALADPKQISDVLDDLSARITRARGGARSAGKPARSDADTGSDRVPRGTQEEVINEIKRVLGDGVRVEWVENMGHAGEAITDEHLAELIRLAATAANPMGVAHHEAFHVFLVRLQKMPGGARIVDALIAAASTKAVQSRLRQALAGQPGALQQLEDPIERVVYAYQFFRADPSLRLTPEAKTWLQKLSLFLRKVVGMLTQAQIADRTFDAFAAGTFNDPVVMRDWFENRLESILPDAAVAFMNKHPIMSSINAILSSGDAFMRETGIPAYTKIAELAQAGLGSAKGFLPERNRRMAQWGNELEAIVRGKSDEEIDAAHRNMQLGREPSNDLERDVRRLLDRFFRYISESNVERPVFGRPGEWESIPFRKNYYPGVWDAEFIAGNRKAFDALLEKHGFGEPKAREKIAENILSGAAAEDVVQGDFDKGFTPYMQATSERQLNTLYDDADSLQFRSKNLVETLQRYLYQGVHRAEYVKSFGNRGEILRDLLSEGIKEGATPTQAKWAADYARAVEGTLGSTIAPQLRQAQGWMLLYQNLRLLPLSMFSAMVDPLAIGMRAGSFQVAARAYVRGMRLAFRGMEESELANMARLIGAIDEKAALESLGQLTGSVYMTKTQRAISDRFFRVIGMTGWNNGMRLAATEAAIEFLRTHTQTPKTHSARWIDELGLKKGDVQFDADGKIKLSRSEGLTREQAERVRQGINKWVNSVVMRPTAAERPIWASSPYFALVFHLKQFTYSFQRNIMRYVFREAQHGNYWPMMVATSYVPTMLAADFMRGMIQGLGDEPDYKKKWTWGDRTWNAVERSGFTGISQFALDSVEDAKRGQTGLETALGPTLGHTSKLLQTLSGDKDVGRFALQSLPGQVIFKHW